MVDVSLDYALLLLQAAEEVVEAFLHWLREEACQPHRDIPLTHHLMVPLVLVKGAVELGWVGWGGTGQDGSPQ